MLVHTVTQDMRGMVGEWTATPTQDVGEEFRQKVVVVNQSTGARTIHYRTLKYVKLDLSGVAAVALGPVGYTGDPYLHTVTTDQSDTSIDRLAGCMLINTGVTPAQDSFGFIQKYVPGDICELYVAAATDVASHLTWDADGVFDIALAEEVAVAVATEADTGQIATCIWAFGTRQPDAA